jgi:hypothetical protein
MNFIVGRMIISAMRTSLTRAPYCTATRPEPRHRENESQNAIVKAGCAGHARKSAIKIGGPTTGRSALQTCNFFFLANIFCSISLGPRKHSVLRLDHLLKVGVRFRCFGFGCAVQCYLLLAFE